MSTLFLFCGKYLTTAAACTRCLAIKVIVSIIIITDTGALFPGRNNLTTLEGGLLPLHHIICSVLKVKARLEGG